MKIDKVHVTISKTTIVNNDYHYLTVRSDDGVSINLALIAGVVVVRDARPDECGSERCHADR